MVVVAGRAESAVPDDGEAGKEASDGSSQCCTLTSQPSPRGSRR